MDLAFGGFVVTDVAIDFSVRLNGSPRGTLKFETPVLIQRADGTSELVDLGAGDLTGDHRFDFLMGLTIEAAIADSTGTLVVTLSEGSRLSAEPSPDYEAWGAVAPDGVRPARHAQPAAPNV